MKFYSHCELVFFISQNYSNEFFDSFLQRMICFNTCDIAFKSCVHSINQKLILILSNQICGKKVHNILHIDCVFLKFNQQFDWSFIKVRETLISHWFFPVSKYVHISFHPNVEKCKHAQKGALLHMSCVSICRAQVKSIREFLVWKY